jgi:hypothetical protein
MSREVTVEELREKLDEIIAEVEAGGSVTVVREKRSGSAHQGKMFPFRDIVISPLKRPIDIDAVDLIRQDRDDEFPR